MVKFEKTIEVRIFFEKILGAYELEIYLSA